MCASPDPERQRQERQNSSKGCHQDRAGANHSGPDEGVFLRHAVVLQPSRGVHEKNGILGDDTDDHDQSDKARDVQRHPCQPECAEDPTEREYPDHEDRERDGEFSEFIQKDEEDEENGRECDEQQAAE